jgi:putative restriction endonuclease
LASGVRVGTIASVSTNDEALRIACFASLDVLAAEFGEDIPYRDGLARGFAFRGSRVPFLAPAKGIFRAAVQRGPAALSVNTSVNSPYDDAVLDDGFAYAYRAGSPDQPDNRALRAAYELQTPLVYFVGTRPGRYRPVYPVFVTADDREVRLVVLSPGAMVGPLDEREPALLRSAVDRRYAVRQIRVRLHQARFRGLVLPAYADKCAVCRLHEVRLLDAAHIIGDLEDAGTATVTNGLSLCSIHHRAFDQQLVGVTPDYEVRVSRALLDEEDGPMLELLKHFHRQQLHVPARASLRPDPERLALRFERFD